MWPSFSHICGLTQIGHQLHLIMHSRLRRYLALLMIAAPMQACCEEPDVYYGFLKPKHYYLGFAGLFTVTAVFDRDIRNDVFYYRNSDPSVDMRRMGDVGQTAGLYLGGLFGAQGIAFNNAKSRQTSVLLIGSFFISGVTAAGIKYVVGRERPNGSNDPEELGRHTPDSSFPSGHTTTAFAAATVIAEQYPKWYIAAPMYGLATGVGVSRMYASKHWASDVIAGAFLGTTISHLLRRHVLKKSNKKTGWELVPSVDSIKLVKQF